MDTSSVVVSVPGKTILLGEHAVVYGQPALVAAVGRRLRLTFHQSPAPSSSAAPCLLLPGAVSLSRSDLDHFLACPPGDRCPSAVRQWLSCKLPSSTPSPAVSTAAALLLILTHDAAFPFPQLRLTLDSAIPVGAGLGSSAALSVAAAAARLLLDGCLPRDSLSWTAADRDSIARLSLLGEAVFHGAPSGLDSAVAAHGGVLAFSRAAGVAPVAVRRRLRLLVADTRVARSTADQVLAVRRRREHDPAAMDAVFAEVGALVRRAQALLEAGDTRLDELVAENQRLLRVMGVSHPAVEAAVAAAAEGGVQAKLTGAGGGGCVVAAVPETWAAEEAVKRRLEELGCEAWVMEAGGEGVRVETAE